MAKVNSIQDRIAKLLAVAKSIPDSPEGEIAMRKAMLWLAKANLTLEEFEASGDDGKTIGELQWNEFLNRPWARQVATSVSKLYFCKVLFFTVPGKKKITVSVIGTKTNTEVAHQISSWVVDCIIKQSRKTCDTTPALNSFRAAAAIAVSDKVRKIIQEEGKTDVGEGTGKSLVLASVYQQKQEENDGYMNSKYKTKTLTKRAKISDPGAAHAGYQYGKSVNLNKQIS